MLWLFSFLHVNTSAWCYYYCVRFINFFVVSLCILCYAALLSFNFAFFSLQSHVTLAIIMHYFTYSSNVYATQNHVKLGVCMRLIEYFEMVWDGRYSLLRNSFFLHFARWQKINHSAFNRRHKKHKSFKGTENKRRTKTHTQNKERKDCNDKRKRYRCLYLCCVDGTCLMAMLERERNMIWKWATDSTHIRRLNR